MSKIVVVDDSKLMRNLIQHILEQAGHEVDAWAEVTAMEVADRILASDPDLVVTDYQMPGCNGLTLARMARKAKPGLPIVVVPNHGTPRLNTLGANHGEPAHA